MAPYPDNAAHVSSLDLGTGTLESTMGSRVKRWPCQLLSAHARLPPAGDETRWQIGSAPQGPVSLMSGLYKPLLWTIMGVYTDTVHRHQGYVCTEIAGGVFRPAQG